MTTSDLSSSIQESLLWEGEKEDLVVQFRSKERRNKFDRPSFFSFFQRKSKNKNLKLRDPQKQQSTLSSLWVFIAIFDFDDVTCCCFSVCFFWWRHTLMNRKGVSKTFFKEWLNKWGRYSKTLLSLILINLEKYLFMAILSSNYRFCLQFYNWET